MSMHAEMTWACAALVCSVATSYELTHVYADFASSCYDSHGMHRPDVGKYAASLQATIPITAGVSFFLLGIENIGGLYVTPAA